MKKIKNLLILVALLFALSGCHIPLLYAMKGMEYEKDIGYQKRSQKWVGKSFVLNEDMYLFTYTYDHPRTLHLQPSGCTKPDIPDCDSYTIIDVVPKGTVIKISNIEQTYLLDHPHGSCKFFVVFRDSAGLERRAQVNELLHADFFDDGEFELYTFRNKFEILEQH